jgi:hypothetical protein
MSAATYPLNEFEWRGHSIMAEAGQVIGAVSKRGSLAITHDRDIRVLHTLASRFEQLNGLFHNAECIAAIENAPEVDLRRTVETMSHIVPEVTGMLEQLRGLRLGYWRRPYKTALARLERLTMEFDVHFRAMAAAQSSVVLLTENDLAQFARALEVPPEPNDALRRAMTRH